MSSPDSFTCILFWTRNTRNCWIQRHIISSVNRVWTYIHKALHCPLSYSNMQDINVDCAQYLLLFFISDRQFKPHMGKLNHLCWWHNVYLLIDYRNKLGLSINMQLWGTLCFYGTRPERCHTPFGSILLLSNKPIAEPVPLHCCLLLDESFLQSLCFPCFQTLAWTYKWTQSAVLSAAAIAAWPKYKKAKNG